MILLNVRVACNDCGEVLEDPTWDSAGEARSFAHSRGWQLVTVHRISLDFCPDCQGHAIAVGQ